MKRHSEFARRLAVVKAHESSPSHSVNMMADAGPDVAARVVDASLVCAHPGGEARAEEIVSFYDMRIGAQELMRC